MGNKRKKTDSLDKILKEKFDGLKALYDAYGIKEPNTRDERKGQPYSELRESEEREEPKEANPDLASETDSPFLPFLSDEAETQLESIKEALAMLPEQQQKIVYLCGYEGYTIQKAADMMGITKSAAFDLLTRARSNIQKIHEKKYE